MNKDVILISNNDNIYPLAHSDSNGEVISDTYQRKEYDTFILLSNQWITRGSPAYYEYTIENINIKATDNPIWDIQVDPTSGIDYKTQVKYRAWCTTLVTENGRMRLYSMNRPEHNITLITMGLKLVNN